MKRYETPYIEYILSSQDDILTSSVDHLEDFDHVLKDDIDWEAGQ